VVFVVGGGFDPYGQWCIRRASGLKSSVRERKEKKRKREKETV
jgi:hypothetical protein